MFLQAPGPQPTPKSTQTKERISDLPSSSHPPSLHNLHATIELAMTNI